ncbi:MAG: iron-sulfur cluster assembly accessory protein [Methylacidiphilales bacterium]|nr:iron-sulfur cluster assembly accessory protein [Candidatus Methylacidiphilales bacterium]
MSATTLSAVTLTESAARHIAEIIGEPNSEGKGLRIYIETGGCSGMSYAMEISPRKPSDEEFSSRGVKLFVEDRGLVYLAGSVIDYKDGLTGAGFRITNPNAKQTCGCGKSFEA